jgi:hypothetical protein
MRRKNLKELIANGACMRRASTCLALLVSAVRFS